MAITNISLWGLGFISRQSYFVGDTVKISLLLPGDSFEIDAEIVRGNDTIKGIEYGVKFVCQDNKIKEELKLLIENIKEREDILSRIVGINI